MLFCGLPQFYADRVDDDIEGPFMFLFDLLMNEPAYGISSSFYFQFYGGDGIVAQGIEETIENVAQLARDGMRETDKKIIEIMIDKI